MAAPFPVINVLFYLSCTLKIHGNKDIALAFSKEIGIPLHFTVHPH